MEVSPVGRKTFRTLKTPPLSVQARPTLPKGESVRSKETDSLAIEKLAPSTNEKAKQTKQIKRSS
jgi:hypothetical protein